MRWILAIWLGLASQALAQDDDTDERARALYEEGTRLYDQGLYEEAVQAFRIAYSLSRRPLLLYNMAQAMERTGEWDEALAALEEYRFDAPDEELATLDSRIAALKERIAEREAQAEVDKPPPEQPVASSSRRGPPPVAWALFGTGAVGIGVGSVFTGRALGARSEWSGACVDGSDGLICPAAASEAWTRDNRSSLVADIGWVVGVAGVGGGVAVTVGGAKASDLSVGVGPRGLRVGGRW